MERFRPAFIPMCANCIFYHNRATLVLNRKGGNVMRILTAAQIRAVEERAVDTGLDYLRLMENAGSACARFVAEKAQITLESNTAATVVCGKGKNGGDGFVIARKLYDKGAEVSVVLAAGHPVAADALESVHA